MGRWRFDLGSVDDDWETDSDGWETGEEGEEEQEELHPGTRAGTRGGPGPDEEAPVVGLLPGSDQPSTAPLLRRGEAPAQRAVRALACDLDLDCHAASGQRAAAATLLSEGLRMLRSGQGADAKRLFAQAVLADPADPEALFGMGLYYEVAHLPELAVQWMDMAIECQPDHALAWVLRSKHLEQQGYLQRALCGYRHALKMHPGHEMAESCHKSILAHQGVYIEPVSSWELGAADAIQAGRGAQPLPPWQENFLRPVPAPVLRQPLLAEGVAAWDGVLSGELLSRLDTAVEHFSRYTSTNGWTCTGGAAATAWLPAGAAPATAPEMAARSILEKILEEAGELAGVEYWGRVRSVNLGADPHYDQAEDACDVAGDWIHGNPWRPQWSSVLYLTDEGGPTVVLDQLHREEGRHLPFVPQRGHLCMPRRNRLVVFRADLFHGSLPVDAWLDSPEMRRVFVFNFWRRHRPEAPHCQRPDLGGHPAMQQLSLGPEERRRLSAAEARQPAPRPLPPRRLRMPEELPHSSDLGYLRAALPMPSVAQLRRLGGLCELDWAAAAAA